MPPKKKSKATKKPTKKLKKIIESNDTDSDSYSEDLMGNLENSDSDSDVYMPNPEENQDDEYDDDDNLDDDKDEIDDEDAYDQENQEPDDNNLQTEDGGDNCLYKFTKNKLQDFNSDEEDYVDEIETENTGKEMLLVGDDRITDPIMTKYEYVRIVGNRAKQIAMGSKKFIKNVDNLSSKEIAMLELKYKMVPYKIKRPLPNNKYEVWRINELEIPNMLGKIRLG